MTESRAERHGLNEAAFRQLNERIAAHDRDAGLARLPIGFVCECFRPDCRLRIQLPADDWNRIHRDSDVFVVAPGHADEPWIESVIERRDLYWLVRKIGEAGAAAAEGAAGGDAA